MTSYNHAAEIGVAIESVLRQSWTDWELVIVDDNSTDNSWDVITSYSDRRIVQIRRLENGGGSAAYNEALRASTGQVIFTLDCDDAYPESKLEAQLSMMSKNPEFGIVGTHIATPFNDPNDASAKAVREWFNTSSDLNSPDCWIWQNRLVHSSVAVTREVHEQIGEARADLTRTSWKRDACRPHRDYD